MMSRYLVFALVVLSQLPLPAAMAAQGGTAPLVPVAAPSLVLSMDGAALPAKPLADFATDGVDKVTTLDPQALDLWRVAENSELTLALKDSPAVHALIVLVYNKVKKEVPELTVCQMLSIAPDNPVTLKLKELECQNGDHIRHGGLLALGNGSKYIPIVALTKVKSPFIGGDSGIALNVLNRSGDSKGARYFDGASFYYSLSGFWKRERLHVIANLSTLDFDDDDEEDKTDFEVGIGLGVLYRVNPNAQPDDGSFTISATYGYNLMTDTGEDGEYFLIGFGWSFGRRK